VLDDNASIGILGYQDMLNQLGLNYGSKEALEVLQKCLGTIKEQAQVNGVKMCISPTGTTSRILKTTPSIEPTGNEYATYWDEIETMEVAQQYLEGGISKTFNLKKNHTTEDINLIIRASAQKNLKGISVFPAQ
jgi:ribonucleotide reductase alpha subunit